MIWRDGECRIADGMFAAIKRHNNGKWGAVIRWGVCAFLVTRDSESEAEAKAAVCHWIGKTMAQFSNALAAGFEQPDDGC